MNTDALFNQFQENITFAQFVQHDDGIHVTVMGAEIWSPPMTAIKSEKDNLWRWQTNGAFVPDTQAAALDTALNAVMMLQVLQETNKIVRSWAKKAKKR